MWVELVAAVLVGVSLLWLVFEPIFTGPGARGPQPVEVDAMDELEDTRSGVALAALKEIEFDRETGKLSDADYDFLKQKYTVEALQALRAEDAEAPDDIEAQVAARVATLQAVAAGGTSCPGCGTLAAAGAHFCAECGRSLGAPTACPTCGTELPSGSRFCGSCGGRVAA
jgi:hypothetical protein